MEEWPGGDILCIGVFCQYLLAPDWRALTNGVSSLLFLLDGETPQRILTTYSGRSGFRSTEGIQGTTAYRYNTLILSFMANPMIYRGHYKFSYTSFYLESLHPSPQAWAACTIRRQGQILTLVQIYWHGKINQQCRRKPEVFSPSLSLPFHFSPLHGSSFRKPLASRVVNTGLPFKSALCTNSSLTLPEDFALCDISRHKCCTSLKHKIYNEKHTCKELSIRNLNLPGIGQKLDKVVSIKCRLQTADRV